MGGLVVHVTILGQKPTSFESSVVNVEKRRIRLHCRTAIPLLTLLKIEANDRLWMGEVVECRADKDCWVAGIEVKHALRDLAALAKLAERFGEQPSAVSDQPLSR